MKAQMMAPHKVFEDGLAEGSVDGGGRWHQGWFEDGLADGSHDDGFTNDDGSYDGANDGFNDGSDDGLAEGSDDGLALGSVDTEG
jgi:hypothetical protein